MRLWDIRTYNCLHAFDEHVTQRPKPARAHSAGSRCSSMFVVSCLVKERAQACMLCHAYRRAFDHQSMLCVFTPDYAMHGLLHMLCRKLVTLKMTGLCNCIQATFNACLVSAVHVPLEHVPFMLLCLPSAYIGDAVAILLLCLLMCMCLQLPVQCS